MTHVTSQQQQKVQKGTAEKVSPQTAAENSHKGRYRLEVTVPDTSSVDRNSSDSR